MADLTQSEIREAMRAAGFDAPAVILAKRRDNTVVFEMRAGGKLQTVKAEEKKASDSDVAAAIAALKV